MQKVKRHQGKRFHFSEHLTKTLDEVFSYPLTIVEAPMGYGKSTAVREYLQHPDVILLWQRVYDDSISNFWQSLCQKIGEMHHELAESLIRLGFPNDSKSRQEAVNIIAKIKLSQKVLLVIDDYHFVDNSEVGGFIEFLAQNEISNLHIVLTARFVGMQNMDELKLKGYLLHISKECFELSGKEIKKYFRLCGIGLKDAEADRLYSLTEGWISALYLFMVNYDPAGDYLRKTDIHTLIEHGVFSGLSENSQELLINMCIFNGFTLEQIRHVWHTGVPASSIDILVAKNAFVTFDYSEKAYYIHSILKSFLAEKLNGKEQSYRNDLYKKSSHWYQEKGEYLFAMRYAYWAGDFFTVFRVLELDKGFSLNSNYKDSFIKYFEECPMEIKQQFPDAMLIIARRLLTFNEGGLFKKACAEFMANLQSSDNLSPQEKNRLLGEYELLMSFTVYNDIEKMSEYHQKASQLLTTASSIIDGRGSWTFGSPSVLYMFYRQSGELEKEVEVIRKAMPFYYQLTNGHGMGADEVMAAERHYNRGDFENAEINMHRAYQAANNNPQTGIIICAMFLQMRLAIIKGDFSNILELLKKMRGDVYDRQWYLFMHTLDMCESYIYGCLNIKNSGQPWINNGEFKNTRLLFPAMAFLNIVYGRTLLINGEYLKLIGSKEQFIGIASVFPNLLGQIYTFIYLAAAHKGISRQDEALAALRQALNLAMPDEVYMPFVENGGFIKSLLQELARQGVFREEISRILQLEQQYQQAVQQITGTYFTERKPELTEREMAIARLVAEGYSNKEVGQRLFVSPNTVKTQLKSIFQKIDITSRVHLKQFLEEI